MTLTKRKLIGNQAFASCQSNALNEMMPMRFTNTTHDTQTIDCMQSKRKFIEKFAPDTTNWVSLILKVTCDYMKSKYLVDYSH